MKALSLYQPYASLWAAGHKRCEVRGWRYKGDLPLVLAIHASLQDAVLPEGRRLLHLAQAVSKLGCPIMYTPRGGVILGLGNLPRGHVIGLVRLVKMAKTEAVLPGIQQEDWAVDLATDQELAVSSDFSPGQYAWIADRFHPLREPARYPGRRHVFDWLTPTLEALEVERAWLEEAPRSQ